MSPDHSPSQSRRRFRGWLLNRLGAVDAQMYEAMRAVGDRRLVRLARFQSGLTTIRDALDDWTVGGVADLSPGEIHEVASLALRDDSDPLEEAIRVR